MTAAANNPTPARPALLASPRLTPAAAARRLAVEAVACLEQGRPAVARSLLERAVAADPAFVSGHLLLARVCLQAGDAAAAEHHASQALRQAPAHVDGLEVRARARLLAGNYAGAEADANAAIVLDPQSADAELCRASVRLAQRKPAEAVAILTRLRDRAPGNVEVLLTLGGAYLAQADPERAEATFRRAGELDPLNWQVYLGLANAALARDDANGGLMQADLALRLGGDVGHVHFARAMALVGLGLLPEAKRALVHATRLNPGDALAWALLAQLQGVNPAERDAAAVHATIAVELAPDGPAATRGRAVLDWLQKAGGRPAAVSST